MEPRTHLFAVEDFHRMADAGILDEDQHVEFVDGVVVEMPPIGSPRMGIVNWATQVFVQRFAGSALVQGAGRVIISDLRQLRPDCRVADLSLLYDPTVKAGPYAATGIPEYWIVDVVPAGGSVAPLACPHDPGAVEEIVGPSASD